MHQGENAYEMSKLKFYSPYEYQLRFHSMKTDTGEHPIVRGLMAGNRIGKTYSAAAEIAIHATGLYPKWWRGKVFKRAPRILVCGVTNETVKKINQKELLGEPDMGTNGFGTGAIPKERISGYTLKRGVPDATESVTVKHMTGRDTIIHFQAYESGKQKFMGTHYDLIWPDEEPPMDIWQQFLRAIVDRKGSIMFTFTPENGYTELVTQLLNEPRDTDAVMQAGWKDAPHITKDEKFMNEMMSQFRPDELDMRMQGVPMPGSGLIYPVNDNDIKIDPIVIPPHWPRICGVDFGWEHPFAAVWVAWDRDSDTAYVYDVYSVRKERPTTHCAAIRKRGEWIPVSWPKDGLNTEKGTGIQLAQQYRDEGLNLFYQPFTNAPQDGQEEGKGGFSVEAGVMHILERMMQGRLKVFSTCQEFFKEKNLYHRKEGKIVDRNDDVLSAVRYAVCYLRHAQTPPNPHANKPKVRHNGARMWA